MRRTKVRKGTHSCYNCRRRKVKCIYATPQSLICTVCQRRGTECVSQLENLSSSIDAVGNGQDTILGTPTAGIPALDTETRAGMHRNVDRPATDEPSAHAAIRKSLLGALPSKADVSILCDRVSLISSVCYEGDYKSHSGLNQSPRPQPLVKSLRDPEKHPVLLARQMLLLAAPMQHLSPDEVLPGLSEHHHVIMKRLAETAIKSGNMDDALTGSLEGLENMLFEAFYHNDCGNIRRGWVAIRRAVATAQLLGLHRPGHYRFVRLREQSDLDPGILWGAIVSLERLLSLLLGLPTSTGYKNLPTQTIDKDAAHVQNLSALIGNLAGRILDRNQMESAGEALAATGKIDREIIGAAKQMPSAFWQPPIFTNLERHSIKALTETRRAFGHMCYYSMVLQLHLPHMLSPQNASQRVYSKIACANASREILSREIELRMFNSNSSYCRLSEFLALIAGMALMLAHITSCHGDEWDQLLAHQRLGDRATVERALGCIDLMSEQQGNAFAARCAALLGDLLRIEGEAARQHSPNAERSGETDSNQRDILIMMVPYLGSIRISRHGLTVIPTNRMEQEQSPPDDVTIGGIGSVLVGQSQPSETGRENENRNAGDAIDRAVPMTTAHGRGYLTPEKFHLPTEQAFADEFVHFHDGAFQGVDTAFIETLLRGSAVAQDDLGLGDVRWDIGNFR